MGGTLCKHGELNCARCAIAQLDLPPVHVTLVTDILIDPNANSVKSSISTTGGVKISK